MAQSENPTDGQVSAKADSTRDGAVPQRLLKSAVPELLLWQLIVPIAITALVLTNQSISAGVLGATAFAALAARRFSVAFAREIINRVPYLLDALLAVVAAVLSLAFCVIMVKPEASILYRLNFGGYDVHANLPPSYVVIAWSLSLATMSIPNSSGNSQKRVMWQSFNSTAATLLALLGAVGLTLALSVSRAQAFADRNRDGGDGLQSLAYWAAAAFVAYVVVGWRKSDSRLAPLAAFLFTAGIFLTGNRSPIAFIAMALLVRLALDHRRRLVVWIIAATPIGLLAFAYQSIWRGQLSRGLPSSPIDIFRQISSDPGLALVKLGLDSVDGHALTVDLLRQGFRAQPSDLLIAVLNFVPRAVWPDKPVLLGGEIGSRYLGTSGSGIFLSGPGYLSLVFGSTIIGAIAFVIFMLLIKRVSNAPRHPFFAAVACYLVARFTIAGDGFDIFLALQLLLIFISAEILSRFVRPRPPSHGVEKA